MLLHLGDIVRMKKPHPCGESLWKVVFVGSDIKIRCERPVFEKRVKRIEKSACPVDQAQD